MNKRQWKKKQNIDIWTRCPICRSMELVQKGNGKGRAIWRYKPCSFCDSWLKVKPMIYSEIFDAINLDDHCKQNWANMYRRGPICFDITPSQKIIRYEQ